MFKAFRVFGILLFISCATVTTFAKDMADSEDYSEPEGNLLFKFRFAGIKTATKSKSLPTPTARNPISVPNFIENGYGADASTSIFFANHAAIELSLGIQVLRTKTTNLSSIANNYSGNQASVGKRKDIYMIPLSAVAQWHIAPFGAIRPYGGVGGFGAYIISKSKGFKIQNGVGGILQLGVDIHAMDNTLFTFDVRQFLLTSKVTYKGGLVNNRSITSKMKINPLVISAGVGFQF